LPSCCCEPPLKFCFTFARLGENYSFPNEAYDYRQHNYFYTLWTHSRTGWARIDKQQKDLTDVDIGKVFLIWFLSPTSRKGTLFTCNPPGIRNDTAYGERYQIVIKRGAKNQGGVAAQRVQGFKSVMGQSHLSSKGQNHLSCTHEEEWINPRIMLLLYSNRKFKK
jgi:hypothetical protein